MVVCAFCFGEVEPADPSMRRCGLCRVLYHPDCWSVSRRCVIYGCGSRPVRPGVQWRTAMLFPMFALAAVVGGWSSGWIAEHVRLPAVERRVRTVLGLENDRQRGPRGWTYDGPTSIEAPRESPFESDTDR